MRKLKAFDFYFSEAFARIFKELNCVCTGFSFDNDYYEKGQVNTHYCIWFEKLVSEQQSESKVGN